MSISDVRYRHKELKMCGLSFHMITKNQPLTNKKDRFDPVSERAGSSSMLFPIKM
jgi:hypothetical protein